MYYFKVFRGYVFKAEVKNSLYARLLFNRKTLLIICLMFEVVLEAPNFRLLKSKIKK